MEKELNDSIINTIGNTGAFDILSEMGEITIDRIIDNDSINQIPIIGTLRTSYKIANSIADHLFLLKLLKFLNSIGQLSESEKESLKDKINNDSKYQDKIGIHLIEIINKIDDTDKPRLIARLFKSFIDGKIDLHKFFKYSQIINQSFLPEIENMKDLINKDSLTADESSSFLSLGLLEVKTKEKKPGAIRLGELAMNNQIEFRINSVGKEIYQILTEYK